MVIGDFISREEFWQLDFICRLWLNVNQPNKMLLSVQKVNICSHCQETGHNSVSHHLFRHGWQRHTFIPSWESLSWRQISNFAVFIGLNHFWIFLLFVYSIFYSTMTYVKHISDQSRFIGQIWREMLEKELFYLHASSKNAIYILKTHTHYLSLSHTHTRTHTHTHTYTPLILV